MEQSKKEECLTGEQETDLVAPYAISWKLQKKDKLVWLWLVTFLGKFRSLYGIL